VQAPVLGDVPYLFFSVHTGGSVNSGLLGLGNASASYSFSSFNGALLSANFDALGQSFNLNGSVDSFGNFSFSTGFGINLAGLVNASATYTFQGSGGAFGLFAQINAGFNISIASGNLDAIIDITSDSFGSVQYSGNGTVSATVFGQTANLSATVSNAAITWDINIGIIHIPVSIPLPH